METLTEGPGDYFLRPSHHLLETSAAEAMPPATTKASRTNLCKPALGRAERANVSPVIQEPRKKPANMPTGHAITYFILAL